MAALEKLKPLYDGLYKIIEVVCKMLLIADIVVVSMTVLGRYVPFIPDPSWSEEITLTLMSYMAVLSAALAIRRKAHIRMTSFDRYLPKTLVNVLDLLADAGVLVLSFVMITVGWKYAMGIGAKGYYPSLPWLSRRYMYFPVPLAGAAMLVFELESIYQNMKLLGKEEL